MRHAAPINERVLRAASESGAAGDRAEGAFILVLPEPICVDGDPKSVDNTEAQAGIREIHVRWFNGDLATLIGKDVIVRGQLSTATIAHDRTPVVLDATNAQAANKPLHPTRPSGAPIVASRRLAS
jgi:hypothetical protein